MGITIEAIGNIAIALSVIVALVFGIAQVKAAERDRRERLTLETLRIFQTREFAEQLSFIRDLEAPTDGESLRAMPRDHQILLIQTAQQMESLGMMVYEHYIDLDLIDQTLGSFVATSWKKYEPMFLDMRASVPDPFLGEYFQWLAERIDERMRESPREPFYKQRIPKR